MDWGALGLAVRAFYNHYPIIVSCACRTKPIIAQVQGYCIAGHNHMAYCCDFTIAADNAILVRPVPGWFARRRFFALPDQGGRCKKAREMDAVSQISRSGSEGDGAGHGTVVPLDKLEAEVDQWCEEMLAKSPGCLPKFSKPLSTRRWMVTRNPVSIPRRCTRLVRHAGGKEVARPSSTSGRPTSKDPQA